MDEIKKSKVSFKIVPITDNDKQVVLNSLRQYFFRDEPLSASINLLEDEETLLKFENYGIDLIKYGVSFMAIDEETGEIMGAALNNTVCRSDEIKQYSDENKCSKYDDMTTVLDKARREADIFGNYPNVDRMMVLKYITVNEEYRGLGICKALINKSKELALELGYQIMCVVCSSNFTAKAVERSGFQCIYSLSYSDYVNKEGEVVFKTQPPHAFLKMHVLLL